MGKVIWPSSNSRRVAARPIMPRRRSGVLHRRGAELLSEKGNGKLRKRQNFPLMSDNVWHVDVSSSPAKPPASTSAPNPKWSACRRNRLQLKRCHSPPPSATPNKLVAPPTPHAPPTPSTSHSTHNPPVTGRFVVTAESVQQTRKGLLQTSLSPEDVECRLKLMFGRYYALAPGSVPMDTDTTLLP